MKMIRYLLPLLLVVAACTPSKNIRTRTGSNILMERNNGEEYDLIIIDSGFDRWFSQHAKAPTFYSLPYYEQQNRRYVSAWNEKASMPQFYNSTNYPFENQIDYDYSKSYGLELNYRLFYYFKYIEDVYGARYSFP